MRDVEDGLTTPERVRAVIANTDPVVRNLQITQSYHELSAALNERDGGVDVAWTAHATWASKQAGSFIRGEEVPAPLRRFLDREGRGWWWPCDPDRGGWREDVVRVAGLPGDGPRRDEASPEAEPPLGRKSLILGKL
jgi:hypothetical protein